MPGTIIAGRFLSEPELIDAISETAQEKGISVSDLVRRIHYEPELLQEVIERRAKRQLKEG